MLTRATRRIGGSRGTDRRATEVLTPIAIGTFTLTTQRVVFRSTIEARAFACGYLLGYQHDPTAPRSFLQLSGREKTVAIEYDRASAQRWRFGLALALASFTGELPALVARLREDVRRHQLAKPVDPILADARPTCCAPRAIVPSPHGSAAVDALESHPRLEATADGPPP